MRKRYVHSPTEPFQAITNGKPESTSEGVMPLSDANTVRV